MKLQIRKKSTNPGFAKPFPSPGKYKVVGNVGTIMTVDPGLGGTGWAVWGRDTFDNLVPPLSSGSIDPRSGDLQHERSFSIADQIHQLALRNSVFVVYIEYPMFMESSGKGMSAARGGDLVTLSVLVGMIASRVADGRSTLYCPVEIPTWKGGMNKDITKTRVLDLLPDYSPSTSTTHEIDAIGIGLHVKGFL